MRKPAALFVAAFATVAGGGLAVAVEGGPRVPDDIPAPSNAGIELVREMQEDGETTTTTVADTTTTTVADTTTTTATTAVEAEPEDDAEGGPPAGSHGAAVSAAARECPRDDPEQNHGECVREVARDNAGHADDDGDEGPGNGRGNGNGNGRDGD